MSSSPQATPAASRPIPTSMLVVLAMCGGFGPFAIDTYISGLPQMTSDFSTSASAAQATLTGFMVALGFMQLVIGPLSDQVGRRRLLMLGTFGAGLASVVCAVAPSIQVLIAGRVLQGVFGAAGIVLSRAIVADLGKGSGMAQAFSILVSIQTVAPVVAPVLGGVLVGFAGWRMVFWFLTVGSIVLSLGCWRLVPESLPPQDRRAGGVKTAAADFGTLLRSGSYLLPVVAFAAAYVVMFAYISASSFVLQRIAGYSQPTYSLLFSINSVMLLVASQINARVVRGRTAPSRVCLIVGRCSALAVAWLALSVTVLHTDGRAMALGFFVIVTCQGFLFPNLTTVAMRYAGIRGGSGSALMGAAQMVIAAAVAPLSGIGGGTTAVPMVVIMVAAVLVLLTTTYAIARRDT